MEPDSSPVSLPSDSQHAAKFSASEVPVDHIKVALELPWTFISRHDQLGVVGCFNGLGTSGHRAGFKIRGEVGEVIVELDEEIERRSLGSCPGFEAKARG